MKKLKKFFCYLLFILFLFNPFMLFSFSNAKIYAKIETTTYAKALVGCVLYKSQLLSPNVEDIYFIVPETYFVAILETISDVCLKVQYKKYIGYVDASTVTIATFIPIIKTLENVKVDIKETSGTQIWSTPSTSGNVYTTISAGTKGIEYIANCYGSIPSGGESNLWYYISFTPNSNSTNVYEGYVYSENVTNLTSISPNNETNPEPISDEGEVGTLYLSDSLKTTILIILIIPCVCVVLIVILKLFSFGKHKKCIKSESSINSNSTNESLHDSIEYFKQNQLVKKSKNVKVNYPKFPEYDPDDELM